jgi:hypothetical protein
MNRHYAHVAERAGNRCEYCHAPEDPDAAELSAELRAIEARPDGAAFLVSTPL